MLSLVEFLIKFSTIDRSFIIDFFGIYDIKNRTNYNVDLDKLTTWLSVRKDTLKATLFESYIQNVDYKIIKLQNKGKRGGQGKEQILLTSDCFKLLAMRSHSKKAERVRRYYLELEKVLDKYKDYIIEGISEKYDLVLNNQKPIITPSKGVIYVIQTADDVSLYKIGKSSNFKNRIRNYNADKADNIKPILVYETDDIDNVEKCLKGHMKEFQYRKYKEVFQVDIGLIKKVLEQCDCNSNTIRLIKRNKPLKQNGGNLYMMIDKSITV